MMVVGVNGHDGGELDEKDRAPSNLAASGAFARASPRLGQAAEEVLRRVERLKGGCPEPLKGFGTPQGVECPLHGSWGLRFTTAADATFTRNSSRGTAKVSNVVDAVSGSVTNCIDFDQPDAAECLRVRLSAEAESKTRLGLAFRYVKVRLTKFFGFSLGQRRLTLTLPVPGPFLTRIITFFTRKTPPKPFFEIIYLDDDLRVHKTGQGNVFVQDTGGAREDGGSRTRYLFKGRPAPACAMGKAKAKPKENANSPAPTAEPKSGSWRWLVALALIAPIVAAWALRAGSVAGNDAETTTDSVTKAPVEDSKPKPKPKKQAVKAAALSEAKRRASSDGQDLAWDPKTISVVLPCAGEGLFAKKTVISVSQSVPGGIGGGILEDIVVVDDGSDPPLSQVLNGGPP
eukprot:s1384_g4.t1